MSTGKIWTGKDRAFALLASIADMRGWSLQYLIDEYCKRHGMMTRPIEKLTAAQTEAALNYWRNR